MPVINIKSLPVRDRINIPEILVRLNQSVANVSGIDPEHVWSYWEFIKSGFYAVGKNIAASVHEQTHSPIIRVTCLEGKTTEQIKIILETIAATISRELDIEYGNMFIVYDNIDPAMVFDGGLGVQIK